MSDEIREDSGIVFIFGVHEEVQTPSGQGTVLMAGVKDNGNRYLVEINGNQTWFDEEEMVTCGSSFSPKPLLRYLTEDE